MGKPVSPKMIIVVGVDSDEMDAGYGVMTQAAFNKWEGGARQKNPDRFSLLFDNHPQCDTYHTFDGAMKAIVEANGRLVNVHAAMAY
jgi:hypothetical protein